MTQKNKIDTKKVVDTVQLPDVAAERLTNKSSHTVSHPTVDGDYDALFTSAYDESILKTNDQYRDAWKHTHETTKQRIKATELEEKNINKTLSMVKAKILKDTAILAYLKLEMQCLTHHMIYGDSDALFTSPSDESKSITIDQHRDACKQLQETIKQRLQAFRLEEKDCKIKLSMVQQKKLKDNVTLDHLNQEMQRLTHNTFDAEYDALLKSPNDEGKLKTINQYRDACIRNHETTKQRLKAARLEQKNAKQTVRVVTQTILKEKYDLGNLEEHLKRLDQQETTCRKAMATTSRVLKKAKSNIK